MGIRCVQAGRRSSLWLHAINGAAVRGISDILRGATDGGRSSAGRFINVSEND